MSGSSYTSLYTNTTPNRNGIQINTELEPNPTHNPNYYPYPDLYTNEYDPVSIKYVGADHVPLDWSQSSAPPASWYVTHWDRNYTNASDAPAGYTRDTTTYTYNSTSWSNNFTSNTYLLNSVVGIDPARDAKLSITKDGVTRGDLSFNTNVFTDRLSGLQINLTPGRQPWDGSATAAIVVGDPQPPLPRNNSNLVAVDEKITAMNSFSVGTAQADWRDAFNYLQDQANKALDYLSYERTIIGGQMNQVAFINTNLRSQSVNLEKSKSDLIDTDVASASGKLYKGEIQTRVAAQMITQANSLVNPIRTLINLWDDIKSK